MHKDTIAEIKQKSELHEVINDFQEVDRNGNNYYTECPLCHKSGKGRGLSMSTKGTKCFSCNYKPGNSIKYLQEMQGKSFIEACEYLVSKYQIIENIYKPKKKRNAKSFCSKQLKSSGLTPKDVKALVQTDNGVVEMDPFSEGTRNQFHEIVDGDDMVIWYFDLAGKPVYYTPSSPTKYIKSRKPKKFYRMRWAFPSQPNHQDKNGRPKKYESPGGSGVHLYIPQAIRNHYVKGAQIKTLYLQEGEKKAEKACKHDILSVGISGIHSIVKKGKIPYDLQLIVKKCNVKNIILVFDSDWQDMSNNPKDGVVADARPKTFFLAAKNFRDHFRSFHNDGIYLDIYIAGLKQFDNDKGLDDLLANTLKGKEELLLEDFNSTLNLKSGDGKYMELIKVTEMPDLELREYWNLHDKDMFAQQHKEKLKGLKEFLFKKIKWRFNDDGNVEQAQPLLPHEEFYQKEEKLNKDGEGTRNYSYFFDYEKAYNFLQNRGYWQYQMLSGQDVLILIDSKIIKIVTSYNIKRFATSFAKATIESFDRNKFMNMLYRSSAKYFGPESLSNMEFYDIAFEKNDKYGQKLFFKNQFWSITADTFKTNDYNHLDNYIWEDKINQFNARLLPERLFKIGKIDSEFIKNNPKTNPELLNFFNVEFSKDAENCHYANFIWNTGDFHWRKHRNKNEDKRTEMEHAETALHFVSKMSAIGYLLHSFFDPSTAKAVIGMDGKLSEIGKSNGGSGKSLLGKALGEVIPQVIVPGKTKNLTVDPFWAEEVTEKTDNVFIDDIRVNTDFEFFFSIITGNFMVNPKGDKKFTIPQEETPKLYFSTNHAVNGEGSSFDRRQFLISFADYYNATFTPIDEFKTNFFIEWDDDQRNLFYNFMGQCIQVYLKHGLVNSPTERLELRKLRQSIGEALIDWADEYYMWDEETTSFGIDQNYRVGHKFPRIDLWKAFEASLSPKARNYWDTRGFGNSFRKYCQFRGAIFNPKKIPKLSDSKIGTADKSGGVEYFTLDVEGFEKQHEGKTPY